ncbi:MAG TPA: HmuY family protein, partial [Chryseolinea sp.]|nr:HmuY family protein [Chryseolinea sp.]
QINIGSKWRSGGGPNSGPALKEDRFYLIKDSSANIYKLKFTALTQNGERGRPQIQFALIKKGE